MEACDLCKAEVERAADERFCPFSFEKGRVHDEAGLRRIVDYMAIVEEISLCPPPIGLCVLSDHNIATDGVISGHSGSGERIPSSTAWIIDKPWEALDA